MEIEQAFLIYSNAQNKRKKEKKEEQKKKRGKKWMSKSNSVNPLAVSTLSNARKVGEY